MMQGIPPQTKQVEKQENSEEKQQQGEDHIKETLLENPPLNPTKDKE
jgi:hypothetical protein